MEEVPRSLIIVKQIVSTNTLLLVTGLAGGLAIGQKGEQQVDEFLKITDDPENRPAFIHCAGAIRVGAFWMIRRVLKDGCSIEAAEEEKHTEVVEARDGRAGCNPRPGTRQTGR